MLCKQPDKIKELYKQIFAKYKNFLSFKQFVQKDKKINNVNIKIKKYKNKILI